jgi:predicted helicase
MNPRTNPKHPKAGKFVELFRNLKYFQELEDRISKIQDNNERGSAFEVFAEAYLATQRKDVNPEHLWPQGAEPSKVRKELRLPLKDYGVDGLYRHPLGSYDVYQVKFRSGRPLLTWEELSTFFGLADDSQQCHRVRAAPQPYT